MGSRIDLINEVKEITSEIKNVEIQDAANPNNFSFRKESYNKMKKLLFRKNTIIEDIINASIFLLKNRLCGSIFKKIVPNDDYFKLLDDQKFYEFHANILKEINNYNMVEEYYPYEFDICEIEYKNEFINSEINLFLLKQVIGIYKKSSTLDENMYEFLYEEIGYNLCIISNIVKLIKKYENPKKENIFEKYDECKEKCFDLFSDLDRCFKKINKREPKNIVVENPLWN